MTPYISKHERARGAWVVPPMVSFDHRGRHYTADDLAGPRCLYCGGPMVKALTDLGEVTHPACPDPEPRKPRGRRKKK